MERRIERISNHAENLRTMRQKGFDLLNDFDLVFQTLSKVLFNFLNFYNIKKLD